MDRDVNQELEECFYISLLPGFSNLGLVTENLDYEFNKILNVNLAVEDFLAGSLDEETFLDIVEYYEQDMDEYVEVVNDNLENILLH